jgi:hypothetical protein
LLLLLLPLLLQMMCLYLQDVFSLGCVIAELWLDGRAFFDLSRLLLFLASSSFSPGGRDFSCIVAGLCIYMVGRL